MLIFGASSAFSEAFTEQEFSVPVSTAAGQAKSRVKLKAGYAEYYKDSNSLYAETNVDVNYEGTVIKCDKLNVAMNDKKIEATGRCSIKDSYFEVSGDTITYDYETKEGVVSNASCGIEDWFFKGPILEKKGDGRVILKNGFCTSCELGSPHYRLAASKIEIVPDEIIKFYFVSLKIGDVPVVPLPYFWINLKKKKEEKKRMKRGNYEFGMSDQDGFFVRAWHPYELIKSTMTDNRISGRAEVRYSQENQFSLGIENSYNFEKTEGDLIVQNSRKVEQRSVLIGGTTEYYDDIKQNWNVYAKHVQDFKNIEGLKLQANAKYMNDSSFNRLNNTYDQTDLYRPDMELVTKELNSEAALTYNRPIYTLGLVTDRKEKFYDYSNKFEIEGMKLPAFNFNLNKTELFKLAKAPVYFNSDFSYSNLYVVERNTYVVEGTSYNAVASTDYVKSAGGNAAFSSNFTFNRVNNFGFSLGYKPSWDINAGTFMDSMVGGFSWQSDLRNVCIVPVKINYGLNWNFRNSVGTQTLSFRLESTRGRTRKKGELEAVILASLAMPGLNSSTTLEIPSLTGMTAYFMKVLLIKY